MASKFKSSASLNRGVLLVWTLKTSLNYQVTLVNIKLRTMGRWGGGGCCICIFLHESLVFKLQPDLSISNEEMEDFSIEIINKNSKNILISTQYKDPLSKSKIFEEYLKKFCQQNQNKK